MNSIWVAYWQPTVKVSDPCVRVTWRISSISPFQLLSEPTLESIRSRGSFIFLWPWSTLIRTVKPWIRMSSEPKWATDWTAGKESLLGVFTWYRYEFHSGTKSNFPNFVPRLHGSQNYDLASYSSENRPLKYKPLLLPPLEQERPRN